MRIYLSRLHYPVTTLGPGRRIGVWFQGCSIQCDGCVSADTWATGRGGTTVDDVVAAMASWLPHAEGITVSGGEPFDQLPALQELLAAIRARTAVDVLVYSGYPVERLGEALATLSGTVDALISDPYDEDAPQTLPLRGSDNQRLHFLTALGNSRFAQYDAPATVPSATANVTHTLDVMFDEDGNAWLAGIPATADMRRLTEVLAAAGHRSKTSQAPSRRQDPA